MSTRVAALYVKPHANIMNSSLYKLAVGGCCFCIVLLLFCLFEYRVMCLCCEAVQGAAAAVVSLATMFRS
jgi:hypothetical protein